MEKEIPYRTCYALESLQEPNDCINQEKSVYVTVCKKLNIFSDISLFSCLSQTNKVILINPFAIEIKTLF